MKIILSRKGFDSVAGGVASPIFQTDDRLISLPIPANGGNGIPYEEIGFDDSTLGAMIADLTGERIWRSSRKTAHLDPDLRRIARGRMPGWRPLFGQADRAQSHLHA
jgi:hypothetical protein